jgi:putative GTP pyrophosphokinase
MVDTGGSSGIQRRDAGLDELWRTRPEVIAQFVASRPDYEQLCAEVRYILEKRLKARGVEVASITSRAKTLTSFLEKVGRERRDSALPLPEIRHLAGVRVVCLYRSDLAAIEKVIRDQFDVREKVDKLEEQGADRFGYGAIHYVVSLGQKSSGARYDDLKGLLCEIQTRTVAQDAWAIISHHLLYKHESAVPSTLRRKLNSLAGVFETADDQFDAIRLERQRYLKEIEEKKDVADILRHELNLDTLMAYSQSKFPGAPVDSDHLSMILAQLDPTRYKNIGDIDDAVARAARAIEQDERDGTSGPYEHSGHYIAMALAFTDPQYREAGGWSEGALRALQRYEDLVEKGG